MVFLEDTVNSMQLVIFVRYFKDALGNAYSHR